MIDDRKTYLTDEQLANFLKHSKVRTLKKLKLLPTLLPVLMLLVRVVLSILRQKR
jgi:hypothetical protein